MNIDLFWAMIGLLALGAFHGINPGMGWLFAVALGLQERKRSAVWRSLSPLALGHALSIVVAVIPALLIGRIIPGAYLNVAVATILFAFGVYRLFRARHPRYGGMRVDGRQLTVWSFLMASAHGAGLMVLPFIVGISGTPGNTEPAELHSTATEHHHVGIVATPPTSSADYAGSAAAAHKVSRGENALAAPESTAASGHATHTEIGHSHGTHGRHTTALATRVPSDPLIGVLAALVHTIGYLLIMGLAAVVVYEKVGLRLLRSAWLNLDFIWACALIATAVLTLVV